MFYFFIFTSSFSVPIGVFISSPQLLQLYVCFSITDSKQITKCQAFQQFLVEAFVEARHIFPRALPHFASHLNHVLYTNMQNRHIYDISYIVQVFQVKTHTKAKINICIAQQQGED